VPHTAVEGTQTPPLLEVPISRFSPSLLPEEKITARQRSDAVTFDKFREWDSLKSLDQGHPDECVESKVCTLSFATEDLASVMLYNAE
jgi:hypothetical protein